MKTREVRTEVRRSRGGFTVIELMVVAAIVGLIAALAVPQLVSARVSVNENAAIATLRTIANAQVQLIASGAIDTNGDGAGEAGYFGELSGLVPTRQWGLGGPAVGAANQMLDPSALGINFRDIFTDGADGVVESQGYYYKMFLPDDSRVAPIAGVPEAPTGGSGAVFPGPENSQLYWCCYAWPVDYSKTGNRAFMVNEAGDVLSTLNTRDQPGGPYESFNRVPAFDAAYSAAGDMSSNLALAIAGAAAQDGLVWTAIGN